MAKIKPKVKVPKTAAVGEVVTIKTLINHPMESGQRKDGDGNKIPRMVIHTFEATFGGKQIVTFHPEGAVSQNLFLEFTMKVPQAGDVNFKWTDDEGSIFEKSASIAIK